MDPTAHPEINDVLHRLLQGVRPILESQFVGMYLYGSLALGDFQPGRSDVDFVVVTEGPPGQETVARLESLHEELGRRREKWWHKLEGAYVPRSVLRRHDERHPPVPTLNEGRFYLSPLGADWIIQRHVLREAGVVLAGPPPRTLIDPVPPQMIPDAVRDVLQQWWEPMLDEPDRLRRPGYQPFAVLSMCRALYTLRTGQLASKSRAAAWAVDVLPEEWHDLIARAQRWRDGEPIAGVERTLAFMRYVVAESRRS
ncbi:MAG: aminoglycoside adenylyltransferase domain-containing protein [bacterium]